MALIWRKLDLIERLGICPLSGKTGIEPISPNDRV
jgi:hypothetical protein